MITDTFDYFVIHNSDGDTNVEKVSKSELEERLKENWYGENPEFLNDIPKERDTNYWGESYLIIKGQIATPKQKQVVTVWEVT